MRLLLLICGVLVSYIYITSPVVKFKPCFVRVPFTKDSGMNQSEEITDILTDATPLPEGWYTLNGTRLAFNAAEICKHQNDTKYIGLVVEPDGSIRNETIDERFKRLRNRRLNAAKKEANQTIYFACGAIVMRLLFDAIRVFLKPYLNAPMRAKKSDSTLPDSVQEGCPNGRIQNYPSGTYSKPY